MSPESRGKIFYGWVIVVTLIFITMVLAGTRFSFGVFFKPLTAEFDLSRTATSSLLSVFTLLCATVTIAGGWALDKYGPKLVFLVLGLFTGMSLVLTSRAISLWQLYITYSLILAVGTGPFYPLLQATISRWFDRKRGLAMGIAGTGGRLGQVVYAPLCAFLISSFGWRTAYLVTGLIAWAILIPLSRLMRHDPRDVGSLPDGAAPEMPFEAVASDNAALPTSGLLLSQAARTANYLILMPIWFTMGFTNLLVFTHVVPYATDMNVSTMAAAAILSVIGGSAIPAGIAAGMISDFTGRKAPLITVSLLRAVSLIGLVWARDPWTFYLFAVIFGISIGGVSITLAALRADIFGKRSLGVILATLDMSYAIGATFGPLLGGWIYDVNGSYSLSFFIAAAGSIIASLTILFLRTNKRPHPA